MNLGSMTFLGVFVLVTMFIAVSCSKEAAREADSYVEKYCFVPNDDLIALAFLDGSGSSRRISFSIKGRFSGVYLGHWTDIAVDWTKIVAIHVEPAKGTLYRFSVEFKPDTRIRPSLFEFGLIDKSCLDRVRGRYGAYLKFIDHNP